MLTDCAKARGSEARPKRNRRMALIVYMCGGDGTKR